MHESDTEKDFLSASIPEERPGLQDIDAVVVLASTARTRGPLRLALRTSVLDVDTLWALDLSCQRPERGTCGRVRWIMNVGGARESDAQGLRDAVGSDQVRIQAARSNYAQFFCPNNPSMTF